LNRQANGRQDQRQRRDTGWYSLGRAQCPQWGLYIQHVRGKTSIGIEEPGSFRTDDIHRAGRHCITVRRRPPFARPAFQDLIAAIDFAVAKDCQRAVSTPALYSFFNAVFLARYLAVIHLVHLSSTCINKGISHDQVYFHPSPNP
jgi:hypothetical protein